MKNTNVLRALLIVLSLVMLLSLFSCDNEQETTKGTTAATTEENSTTEADETTVETTVETTDKPADEPTDEPTDKPTVETDAKVDEIDSSDETDKSEQTEGSDTETVVETDENTETPTDTDEETVGETETEVVVCEHKATTYAYASDGDASTKLAVLAEKCKKCGEIVSTKSASFYAAIEAIYGNDSGNASNVVLFQADATNAPIMGSTKVTLGAGYDKCPAGGVHPIDYSSATGFAGMLGVSGWAGYVGSSVNDGAAFMAVDQDGNVVLNWTPITGILSAAGLNLTAPAGDAVDSMLAGTYSDASVSGIRFNHIIDVRGYSELAGKTVDIIFAFTTSKGVDGDVYIPYLTIEDVQIPAAQ